MRNDFAVFIVTHGRANQQKTLKTIRKCGYTGKIYLIIDDMDEQQEEYEKLYGDMVVKFSKEKTAPQVDTMNNRIEYKSAVYARYECYHIAEQLGLRFALVCDDDISGISFRIIKGQKLKSFTVKNLDIVLEDMCSIMESEPMAIFGFAQSGAFIGGITDKYLHGCHRRVSQAMMIDTKTPVMPRGLVFEDALMAMDAGMQGKIAMSTMLVQVSSPQMGMNSGGMHDYYQKASFYAPCFYSVIAHPDKVRIISSKDGMKLRFNNKALAPMIISDRWKK